MHQRSLPGPQGFSPTLQGVSMQRGVSPQPRAPQDGDSSWSSRRRRGSGLCLCPPSAAPLWAWVLIAALLVPGARSYLSEEQEELLVELHNHYRGQVSPSASAMLPLRWDPSLKLLAEGYAAKCVWNHNPDLEDTGENLFAGTARWTSGRRWRNGSWNIWTMTSRTTAVMKTRCADITHRWCGQILTEWAVRSISVTTWRA
ncbi:hypothetical protein EPR50_G00082170 [Perca flavescens]|uniref:SCP domain-containing protein n=1 Tax=Perca flavescens TaxID=8167 RepID=A0A484D7E2_PERFV|nr:hypothetical protein EPR50_G00082170 [Perca flavescens]